MPASDAGMSGSARMPGMFHSHARLFLLVVFSKLERTWFIAIFMGYVWFRPSHRLTFSVPGVRNYVKLNHSLHLFSVFISPHIPQKEWMETGWNEAKRAPKRGGGSYGGLTDLLCTFGGGMWGRWKGCPPPGVDGSTGRWKTMGNIMTILGCWGPRLAPLDFPLMAPGTQLRLITSKMILYYRRLAAQGHLEVLRTKACCSLDGQEGSVKKHNSSVLTTLTVPGWL